MFMGTAETYFWYPHPPDEHGSRVPARIRRHLLFHLHRVVREVIMQLQVVNDAVKVLGVVPVSVKPQHLSVVPQEVTQRVHRVAGLPRERPLRGN